jgi:DNA-binding response OmpR family regulator
LVYSGVALPVVAIGQLSILDMSNKILLLEDDPKLANEISQYFTTKGFQCQVAYDGSMLLKMRNLSSYEIYILDINVPVLNGLQVCRQIRQEDKATPILMLTAFGDVSDKVEALYLGADDYVVKPFHFDELYARVNALLRRSGRPQSEKEEAITVEDLVINPLQMTITRAGRRVELTPKEFKLLELLAKAKGRPVSKQTISEQVWDLNFDTGTNTIEVYINFLRNKIDKGHEVKLIHTRPGFGYYLKAND